MKNLAAVLVAGCMMAAGMQADAAGMSQEQKDLCLLESKQCVTSVDSLQTKIKKLQEEIRKGNRVYSPEEIKKLNMKLKEAESQVDVLIGVKGGN